MAYVAYTHVPMNYSPKDVTQLPKPNKDLSPHRVLIEGVVGGNIKELLGGPQTFSL
jgi:hypothetical protein